MPCFIKLRCTMGSLIKVVFRGELFPNCLAPPHGVALTQATVQPNAVP